MAHTIEGSEYVGFRVMDDKVGALTGRHRTAEEALAAAGITEAKTEAKPAAAKATPKRAPRARKTSAEKPPVEAVTTADVAPKADES